MCHLPLALLGLVTHWSMSSVIGMRHRPSFRIEKYRIPFACACVAHPIKSASDCVYDPVHCWPLPWVTAVHEVSSKVGISVGCILGSVEGSRVGSNVGEIGAVVGCKVGFEGGKLVGMFVGDIDGFKDGSLVGSADG